MEPTIGRKSTRQRQMEFNNLVSIKGQKKIWLTQIFPKVFVEFFPILFSNSFRVVIT